jgi:hypothetical protein
LSERPGETSGRLFLKIRELLFTGPACKTHQIAGVAQWQSCSFPSY